MNKFYDKNFKKRFWKISRWYLGLFILLFIFRLIYGYVVVSKNIDSNGSGYGEDFFSNIDNLRKNYASEKIVKEGALPGGPNLNAISNQKFEKTASVKTKTSEFDKDEKSIKSKVKSYDAVIQYEQNLGQKRNRQIHLLIGVNPDKFDEFYLDVQKIGRVKNAEITKVDKTNEYRQLNAKKNSIENTLESLKELKSKGGQISDFISLNEKILEVEEKLQELGVELGNFDSVNEFCTVKLSIYEEKPEKQISFIHRLKVAFEWSIEYISIIIFTSFVFFISIFVLLLVIDKLKVITISNK